MKTKSRVAAALLAVCFASGAALAAAADETVILKGVQFVSQAKISLETARATALKARPGIITDEELEKEKGGSGLRYSFDIKSDSKTYEVGVDARTGAILENALEGKNPD
jgi:uncharacterized membrane protein YkoI